MLKVSIIISSLFIYPNYLNCTFLTFHFILNKHHFENEFDILKQWQLKKRQTYMCVCVWVWYEWVDIICRPYPNNTRSTSNGHKIQEQDSWTATWVRGIESLSENLIIGIILMVNHAYFILSLIIGRWIWYVCRYVHTIITIQYIFLKAKRLIKDGSCHVAAYDEPRFMAT